MISRPDCTSRSPAGSFLQQGGLPLSLGGRCQAQRDRSAQLRIALLDETLRPTMDLGLQEERLLRSRFDGQRKPKLALFIRQVGSRTDDAAIDKVVEPVKATSISDMPCDAPASIRSDAIAYDRITSLSGRNWPNSSRSYRRGLHQGLRGGDLGAGGSGWADLGIR